MKKVIVVNGKAYGHIKDIPSGEFYFVDVVSIPDESDLPDMIDIGGHAYIPREMFLTWLVVLAQENKITAVKWIRNIIGWGLKESKYFIESL